jgi:hypothetical protein
VKKHTHIHFLIFLLIAISCSKDNTDTVAWLGNETISKSELKHWMLLEKANVYNYFYRKYGVNDSDDFWTQKLGNEVPLEKLKETALEKARRCKVQQIIALKKGIIKTANFDEIISELEKVNVERNMKVENNEPIYGPVQFTSRTYFFHVFDKMQIELKTELAKDELKPSKDVLLSMQKDKADAKKDISGFLTMQYVDKNYDTYIDKLVYVADMKINTKVYKKISVN